MNSRAATSAWTTWTLTRTTQIGGQTWFVLETRKGDSTTAIETLYRAEPDGRVHRIPGYLGDLREELRLDPSNTAQPPAVLMVQQRDVPVTTPFGPLPALNYRLRSSPRGNGNAGSRARPAQLHQHRRRRLLRRIRFQSDSRRGEDRPGHRLHESCQYRLRCRGEPDP